MENIQPIIDESPLDYCFLLEDVYGKGLISEGGTQAIDELFQGLDLNEKRIVDIGSGLGGLCFYLAAKYDCQITGLEINEKMMKEAKNRIPSDLKDKVDFRLYSDFLSLPIEDCSVDIVCSKGVLVHVNDKTTLFKSLYRKLKHYGSLVINDWLCNNSGKWGDKIQRMCDLEGLTLYPVTETNYKKYLNISGFNIQKLQDRSLDYSTYNQGLVDLLNEQKHSFIDKYGHKTWKESIEGYQLISHSQENGELLVKDIVAIKR